MLQTSNLYVGRGGEERGCIYDRLALKDEQQDEDEEDEEDEGACIYDGLALKDEPQWPTRVAGSWPTRAPHKYVFFFIFPKLPGQ